MANMMYTNVMMFGNMLPPEERANFANCMIRGLQGFIPGPAPTAPKPVHFAQGPPSLGLFPAIPEIKFEGPIWDSTTMIPGDMRMNASSPAFVPK